MSGRQEGVLDPALGGPPPPPQAQQDLRPDGPPPPQYGTPGGYYGYAPPGHQEPSPVQDQSYQQQYAIPDGVSGVQSTPPQYAMPPGQSPGYALQQGQSPPPGQNDPKRPRACDACRALKVKCELAIDRPELPCKRCAKGNKVCNISEPTRKRQKKSDSRVAELEKRLEELTSAVQAQAGSSRVPPAFASPSDQSSERTLNVSYGGQSSVQSYSTPTGYPTHSTDSGQAPKRRRTDDAQYPEVPAYPQHRSDQQLANINKDDATLEHSWGIASDVTRFLHHITPADFIQRINSLIPPHQATVFFERYNAELAPHLPAVVFPPGTTAEQLYKEKPLLYLAVIGAASWGQIDPEISRQVIREAVGAIADCAIRNGAKSLELVQAMQIIALWYKPPEQTEQTNFYQIIHIAGVMALDIGLGQRFKLRRRGFTGPTKDFAPGTGMKMMPVDSDALDARRAWLGCYYLCASASMVLRRPNLVRWTNYMAECVTELETHPDAAPTDRLFCQHIKLQHICEQIGQQFYMDDPSAAKIDINDASVSYNVKSLENDLSEWKKNIPADCRVPGLVFFEHVCNLYAHEIVLHHNHNVDDFKMPFSEDSLRNVNTGSGTLSQNQITALRACVVAAHGILDTMMTFDYETFTTLPMLLYFVRCVYAIVILIKMHVAVHMPSSELGKLFEPDDLRVEFYLNGLIAHFANTGQQRQTRPDKVLRILGVLRDWFEEKHKKDIAAAQRGETASDTSQQDQKPTADQPQQSGLQMLSQVATGHQPTALPTDWTFDRPNTMPYVPRGPAAQQPFVHPTDGSYTNFGNPGGAGNEQDFFTGNTGWDLGVQQAMDMALGDMNGLQGNGLDNWLLGGESMMPFVGYDNTGNGGAPGF